ncbi:TetR/AcrR family transcriptional regulator [Streptomyces sp. PSKA30]|uniref:TetR/AcrR family transcriptional regulator n=1 Tax=Streptomyces sp. PSKA30 TaxID=2874597 RepID=UPI001CD0C7AB|nr:TetR/AcrR family transcriptional regulator [Streptomyces sp. PSKA30]MBZ9643332.1 TetR/AcrR family transcriptional regulator [Streptomyces sp. PSKA30]
MGRISAQERRQSVIRAAIAEFALRGYYGTSTEAIAKRVGVTQPYLFRLFPGKQAIFVAALMRSMEDTRLAFERAAEGVKGSEQALHAMEKAYARLISAHPETLLIQGYALVAAAEAQGDDQIGELVRAGWMRLWETVRLPLSADAVETTAFLAHGMLINTLTAIGLPSDCREAKL